MIAITPAIAPLAAKLGGARAVVIGFGLATVGFAALAFVQASWEYWAFLAPLVGLSIGLGLANGPASSGSTAAVSADEVGQASGISNMSRYVGAAVAVAAVATINNTVAENHRGGGRLGVRGAGGRPRELRAADGDPLRRGRPARRAHAPPERSPGHARSTAPPRPRSPPTRFPSNPLPHERKEPSCRLTNCDPRSTR